MAAPLPQLALAAGLVALCVVVEIVVRVRGGWGFRRYRPRGVWVWGWFPLFGGGCALPFSSYRPFGFYLFQGPGGFRRRCLWSVLWPLLLGCFVGLFVPTWYVLSSMSLLPAAICFLVAGVILLCVLCRPLNWLINKFDMSPLP